MPAFQPEVNCEKNCTTISMQTIRKNSRMQLHSAALAIPLEEMARPQEPSVSPFLNSKVDEGSSSPSCMNDVHGTLNSVLWDIPRIANQILFKSHTDPIATTNAFKSHKIQMEPLLLHDLTEFWGNDFDFITSSSCSSSLRAPIVDLTPVKKATESFEVAGELANSDTKSEDCRDFHKAEACSDVQPKETMRGKHQRLMKRQLKIETEAWQQAIQEYKDTLEEMCKNQLAPNLPFMKSMFLSWFEPLVNAIKAEQEAYQQGDYRLNRSSYGPYLALLPADKLAVITMHKTVAKLLTEDANVGLRVIVPVLSIGEAVEQEVRIPISCFDLSEILTFTDVTDFFKHVDIHIMAKEE